MAKHSCVSEPFASSSLAGLLAVLVAGCGAGSPPTGSGGTGGAGGVPTISFTCPGGHVTPGANTLDVGGAVRSFYADFPADKARAAGVVFSWHGFTDSVEHHRQIAGLAPDGDPSQPLIVITPDDTGLLPPRGLDWDIAKGTPADANVDLAFFEAMLGCLNAQYTLDPARIYSFGFSAGSVMTSLLHSRYPKLLSAIVAVSGAWFNDPAEAALVNGFVVDWNWPPLDPKDGGTVLLTHGGARDVTILNVLDLEKAAQAAFPFLAAHGRVVVDCAHDQGHALDPDVTPALLSRFFSAHRAGRPSPYASGGYAGFPASCTLRLP